MVENGTLMNIPKIIKYIVSITKKKECLWRNIFPIQEKLDNLKNDFRIQIFMYCWFNIL